jgi:DNA invertase Pin-like site-specific DNA recombinase
MRLSKEEKNGREESCSIENQRVLLQEYAEAHFETYEWYEFVDDGFSGTNMKRPALQELLGCVEQHQIDCIIVKDFSRFSRDYLEAGLYMEQIFPLHGIRFISVNDNYDSNFHSGSTAGPEQAFQNLLNDLYSKDLSVKVKASLDNKKERGIYCSANCPFGYRKKAGDVHQVEIVEEEAAVIRQIFRMALEGCTASAIARELDRRHIKTPMEFRMMRSTVQDFLPNGSALVWNRGTVSSILKNRFYTGDVIYGKYEQKSVGGKPRLRPRSEWKVLSGHHEAVIDRSVFEKAQEIRNLRCTGRKAVDGTCQGEKTDDVI